MANTENPLKRNDTQEFHSQKLTSNADSSSPVRPIAEEHSRFSRKEKWFIVCFTAFVGSQCIFVFQGIAPMLWGPVSDHVGRRPISAACLLILSLSCVGLALVPTSDYWLLMLLRCLQATGSASTIAIGAGVVGDISSRAERGGFFGIFTMGPMIGPSIGPVIGGLLSDHLGWRSIFWFVCIAASICFIIIILVQPETLPSIVNGGRVDHLSSVYKPVFPLIGKKPVSTNTIYTHRKVPKNPFPLFLNRDVDILLGISAFACAVFYGVVATVSSLFVNAYPFLNESTIGLCFLAIGGGMTTGSLVNGRVLDLEYQTFKKMSAAVQSSNEESKGADMYREENFPLEKARLRLMPLYAIMLAGACAGNGWCIQKQVNLGGPLVLQFIVGFSSTALMNTVSTLMIDLVPGQSSSVTACNNLIRCSLSAIIVSVIEPVIKALGTGWTYVLLSGLSLMTIPLIFLSMWLGPRYRVGRQRIRECRENAVQDSHQK